MRRIIAVVMVASVAMAGRVERVAVDLGRPQQQVVVQITEQLDNVVEAIIKKDGADYDIAGWLGVLWYGDDKGGMAVTNTVGQIGRMQWRIKPEQTPINGRYTMQISGVHKGKNIMQEWCRGVMVVRKNPSEDSMPADWSAGSALALIVAHTNDAAIHLTPEQVERIANAITSAPPQTVTSVNGKTGTVVLAAADVGAATPGDLAGFLPLAGGTMEPGATITLPPVRGGLDSGHAKLHPGKLEVYDEWRNVSVTPHGMTVSDTYSVHPPGEPPPTPESRSATYGPKGITKPGGSLYIHPDTPGGGTIATKEDIPPPGLTIQEADSRYLSSTPGWFWQGSKAVITNEWTGVPHAPAQAGPGVNNFELIPYTTSRTDATGTVTITSSHYIVGVGCDWHIAMPDDIWLPKNPMVTASRRIDGYTWELTAHCSANPTDANPFWFAYASNIVVMTYDRIEMRPGAYTNDAAGIITRVDDAPRGRNSTRFDDDRRAVNAGTLEAYINDRKTEIADHAYNRTPGGRDAPSKYTFTVDLPMVMQGQIAYLNSGDYYIMSYQGGDWYNSVTGSVWRIGPAGSVSFEIASTNRLLHIQGFHVSGGYATVDISTNWVAGTPVVEFTDSLINQQWLEAPEQIATDHGSYWRVVLPSGDKKMRFFRAVDRQGDNRIISHVTHEFKDDIILFGRRYSSLAELKQALEELD